LPIALFAAAMSEHDPTRLSDFELITAMKLLVKKDHEANARLICFLREVNEREIHLAKGCSTLELFCEAVLGLTENQARMRVRAMRLAQAIPAVEEMVRQGDLTLSVASLAQSRFSQVEKNSLRLSEAKQSEIVSRLSRCSLREAERVLAETVGGPAPPKEKKTAYAGGNTRLEFTASATLMENIERLQDLLAHKNFDGRLDLLFEYVSEIALAELEKKSFVEPEEVLAKTENVTRHIPLQVQRAVWLRDGGCCQFRDEESGRVCGSRRWVQIDHILEFSRGGKHEISNLRLLCGAHNRYAFRRNVRAEAARAAAG
jgi:hypothetical protein